MAGCVIAGLLIAAAASPLARASTWSEARAGTAATLFSVSCPSSSLCVAVGSSNTVTTSTNPGGGTGAWHTDTVGQGAVEGPYSSPARQIRSVACPTGGFCVAVSYEGLIYTSTNPTAGAGAWSLADLNPSGPNTHMYGISCPSPGLCVAVGGRGKLLTSTAPASGPGAWNLTQLPEGLELRGVSCPSAALCVAVGNEGQIVSSTNPTGGAGAWSLTQLPGAPIDRYLYGVACPSTGLCLTGNSISTIFSSIAPTGPAANWRGVQTPGTLQITAVECPTTSACIAIDNNADVLTSTEPTGAGSWSFANLLPFPIVDEEDTVEANGTFGVSCTSPSFCVIVGARGQIFTSTDPFAAAPAPAPAKKRKRKHRRRGKGPKRPRAVIGARPPPGTEIRGHKTKLRFRFYAAKHASVRGFVCRLDHRPLGWCRSPKSIRVGIGIHNFSVRAIGWTGRRGPPARIGFKVCHPTKLAYCIGAFHHD